MIFVRSTFVALVVPMMLATTACGSSSGGAAPSGNGAGGAGTGKGGSSAGGASAGGTGAGAGGSGTGGTTAACTESGDLDIDGLWAAKVRLDVSLQSAPGGVVAVCPMDQKGPSELLVLFEIKQNGSTITAITPHACTFTLPSATAMAGGCNGTMPGSVTAQVSASAALAATLPSYPLPSVGGKLSGTAPGAMFVPDRVGVVLGSKKPDGKNMAHWLPSASCDNLMNPKGTDGTCDPTCVSDCADALDQDMDGNLGVTLTVCGQSNEAAGAMCHADDPQTPGWTLQGKAFLNVLLDPLLIGIAKSSCQIDGTNVDANITYDIVGGNVWLSGAQISVGEVIKAIPTFKVSAATSKFTALRVDGKHGSPTWGLDLTNMKAACDTATKQAKSAF